MISLRELNQLAESLGLGPDTVITIGNGLEPASVLQVETPAIDPARASSIRPDGAPVLCLCGYIDPEPSAVWRCESLEEDDSLRGCWLDADGDWHEGLPPAPLVASAIPFPGRAPA